MTLGIRSPTSLRPRRSKSKSLAPLSAVQKVENSWSIVSSDIGSLGIDFFLRVFLDVPSAMDLFLGTLQMDAEEMEQIKESQVKIIHFVKENKMIHAHARLVIMEMGRCVAGLDDVGTLVPRLRSLGRMHGAAGVKPEHYGIFFKHLMAAVKDRVISSNSNAWDSSTEEAWLTVRDCMSAILSKPDVSVGSIDGGGNLNRWGIISGAASFYACIMTPLRVSGIGYGFTVGGAASLFPNWDLGYYELLHHYGFHLLDAVVIAVFAIESFAYVLLRQIKVKDLREVRKLSSRKLQRASPIGKGTIILRALGIHEAVLFPISNVVYIMSYLLQNITFSGSNGLEFGGTLDMDMEYNNTFSESVSPSFESTLDSSQNTSFKVGVQWTWGLGLLRLVVYFRAIYVLRCAELLYTVTQRADRMTMRISRLVLGLVYTSHVSACLYVLVARIELGPNAYYDSEHAEQLASSFFPDYTILGKENGMLTNYLRCIHFAFTNLAGIGNHESIPYTALEIMFTLTVNALGATLYAYTTGLLLSMIEPMAERANQFGDAAAALTEFMTDVGMPSEDQNRFMQGFILREMGSSKSSDDDGRNIGPYAPSPGTNATSPDYPENLAKNLPGHLRDELHNLALVDAMKRRERTFRRCSDAFLGALVSSLKQSLTLLPGDYIIREGQNVPSQLLIVEQGTLEVVADGNYIRTFKRGDMISFHWVDSSNNLIISSRHPKGSGSYSPLLLSQSVAYAGVRAMGYCKIATGLSSKSEKKEIKKRYPSDWAELDETLENAKGRKRSKSTTIGDDVSRVDPGCPGSGTKSLDESSHNRTKRSSVRQKIRRFSQKL